MSQRNWPTIDSPARLVMTGLIALIVFCAAMVFISWPAKAMEFDTPGTLKSVVCESVTEVIHAAKIKERQQKLQWSAVADLLNLQAGRRVCWMQAVLNYGQPEGHVLMFNRVYDVRPVVEGLFSSGPGYGYMLLLARWLSI